MVESLTLQLHLHGESLLSTFKKRKGGKASLMKLDISIHPLSIDGIKLPGISVAYPTAVIKPKSQRKLSCKKSTSAKFSIAPSTGQMLVRAFGLF